MYHVMFHVTRILCRTTRPRDSSSVPPQMSENGLSEAESDLDGFLVHDEQPAIPAARDELPEPENDRLADLNMALRGNESYTQKVLKAHILVLVSALGGPDHSAGVSPPPYKLGHDALACLKDIKKWIKSVDERNRSHDVAIACAESGLVINDLIIILCQWENDCKKQKKASRASEKVVLACLELLVLLTWPADPLSTLLERQRLGFAAVNRAHVTYKKHILAYNKGQCLKAVLRLALPTLAKQKLDREPRDNAVLRLVLFFLRNVAYIEPAASSYARKSSTKQITRNDSLPASVAPEDVSLNAVLASFHTNKVTMFLLTISSSVGTDFDKEMFGHLVLETVFLLSKGVDVHQVISNKLPVSGQQKDAVSVPAASSETLKLQELLSEETRRKKIGNQSVSTRHGRFGSLLSIQNDDTSYVVSGQDALHNTNLTLEKLDRLKKWNNKKSFKYDANLFVSANPVYLNAGSAAILREFTEQFLASGCFNNVVGCVSWMLSSSFTSLSALSVLDSADAYEKATYFLHVAWFFKYKRERNLLWADKLLLDDQDPLDYGSVGTALSEVNFVLLLSYLRESHDSKDWNSLHVALICLKEMLLIAFTIFSKDKTSENDDISDDMELADGIVRKLFSRKDFLDLLVTIPQTAAKHSPEYLSVVVAVVHIVLKSFESFANQDYKLYIKTKRKLSKKQQQKLQEQQHEYFNEEDEDEAKEVTSERKVDFKLTELRFFRTATVTTYIEYLLRYEDLSNEEIKRCIGYFHRLFVIRKDFSGLYRLDFMHTLYQLRKHLSRGSSIRKHVDEFISYFMKKFKVAFARFPLPIELLFPRFEDLAAKTFISVGELDETEIDISEPRLARDLEFIDEDILKEEKLMNLVIILAESGKKDFIKWFTRELDRILKARLLEAAEGPKIMVLEPSLAQKRLLINNAHIRLLLAEVGFEIPYLLSEKTEFPASVSNESLTESLDLLQKLLGEVSSEETTSIVLRGLREKNAYQDYDDEYDDGRYGFDKLDDGPLTLQRVGELDELEQLESQLDQKKGTARKKGIRFETKQPRKHREKPKKTSEKPKKSRRSRPPKSFEVNDEEEEDHGPKSAQFVHDSDDESGDEKMGEFFEREERLRKLLSESGGIVSHLQLVEFRETWSKLNHGEVTQKAMEITRGLLNEPEVESEDSDSDHSVLDKHSGDSLTSETDSPRKRDGEEEETVYKRRRIAVEDDGEEDDGEEEEVVVVRKRAVISDDED